MALQFCRSPQWWITGGLGGLGLLFAYWASSSQQRITLQDIAGYHTFPNSTHLCNNGESMCTLARGDVTCAEDASINLRSEATASYGVMHAAGILKVCVIHLCTSCRISEPISLMTCLCIFKPNVPNAH